MVKRSGCVPGDLGSNPSPSSSKLLPWYIGCAPAFQAGEVGSNPTGRSNSIIINVYLSDL